MALNPGQIKITTGTFGTDTTAQLDLIANQAAYPQIRPLLERVQRRQMTTLITAGVVTPYGIKYDKPTNIPDVASKGTKGIGADAYQFRIMGRIESISPIVGQIGASNTDGSFTLKMQDDTQTIGNNVTFYGGRKMARVMAGPRATSGGFLYDFQTASREVFDYSTWVTPQSGVKFCFTSHTTFGEQSLRGYGYSKYPDMFINHMSTQRQSISITGDANTQVLWLNYLGTDGVERKGWMPESISQTRAKMAVQDERAKLFGVSSMKNADGTLATVSNYVDPQTGRPVIQGDGLEEQIAGGNVVYGSGVNGQPTIDDISDLMITLRQKGNEVSGYTWLYLTGTVGYMNIQQVAVNHLGNQGIQLMQYITQDGKPGGANVDAGYTFGKINIGGSSIVVCEHPLLDDPLFASEIGADGKSKLSGTVFVLPIKEENSDNIEILHKAAYGVNRSMIEATLNGMTGAPEMVLSQEDSKTYAILKQDMINIYNTQIAAMIYPTN
jgi:hypothetical protein